VAITVNRCDLRHTDKRHTKILARVVGFYRRKLGCIFNALIGRRRCAAIRLPSTNSTFVPLKRNAGIRAGSENSKAAKRNRILGGTESEGTKTVGTIERYLGPTCRSRNVSGKWTSFGVLPDEIRCNAAEEEDANEVKSSDIFS